MPIFENLVTDYDKNIMFYLPGNVSLPYFLNIVIESV